MKALQLCALGLLMSIPVWADEPGAQKPPVDEEEISKEIKSVLVGFEKRREIDTKRRNEAIAALKSGKPVTTPNEAGVVRKYEDFYARNPALRQFEPSSRGRVEEERARADAANAAARKRAKEEIKRLEVEGRKTAAQIFIPRYTKNEIDELAQLGPHSQFPGQHPEERLGLQTVGIYGGMFRVERILNANAALISNLGKRGDGQEQLCLHTTTDGLKPGMEINLDKKLHYLPGIEKVSYSTGENTAVVDSPLVIIAPYPGSVDELASAWEKIYKDAVVAPGVAGKHGVDDESIAARKLDSAKGAMKRNVTTGRARLREIVKDYSGTRAATEAQRLLQKK